ncbi:hypothetical protein ACFE04_017577 [Oxalis oulophora]
MEKTSKDLLHLETSSSSSQQLESTLLVCNHHHKDKDNDNENSTLPPHRQTRPQIAPIPKSQFLGKVRDFLGIMSEANKKLDLEAKDNADACNIETLTGNESQLIEIDLMLGVADLNTPEAVAAAEAAIGGRQPDVIPVDVSSSASESEDSSDDDEDSDDDMTLSTSRGTKRFKSGDESNKQSKIVELP